jgi:hypothetical protein
MDPAALIAAALKRKFAHRDIENDNDDWVEKEKELLDRRAAKAASPPKVRVDLGVECLYDGTWLCGVLQIKSHCLFVYAFHPTQARLWKALAEEAGAGQRAAQPAGPQKPTLGLRPPNGGVSHSEEKMTGHCQSLYAGQHRRPTWRLAPMLREPTYQVTAILGERKLKDSLKNFIVKDRDRSSVLCVWVAQMCAAYRFSLFALFSISVLKGCCAVSTGMAYAPKEGRVPSADPT